METDYRIVFYYTKLFLKMNFNEIGEFEIVSIIPKEEMQMMMMIMMINYKT